MNILIVNTYHYLRGGDCRLALGMANLLESAGHEVHFFSMKSGQNIPCADERYFVSHIDYREAIQGRKPIKAARVAWRSIYSIEARKNTAWLLDDVRPDVAHLHSIRHHLTKSILPELGKRNIPVVWTLHDYKELCPNTSFYDGRNICESCKGRRYVNVIRRRCKKGSLGASLVTYLEAKVNGSNRYDKYVDLYISPSMFLRNKFIEHGYDQKKIIHIPNFIELEEFEPHYDFEDYLLFIGRLEREKGLVTLINSFAKRKVGKTLRLKIAGTGSLNEELRAHVKRMKLSSVEFLGYKSGKELEDLTRKAKAIVIPSEWYENYPYSGLEAMAYGKPIIGSRIGGIPEQVEDGVTGLLFEPFDEKDLATKIDLLNKLSDKEIEKMGRSAREKVEQVNDRTVYLNKLLGIYHELIDRKLGNDDVKMGN